LHIRRCYELFISHIEPAQLSGERGKANNVAIFSPLYKTSVAILIEI